MGYSELDFNFHRPLDGKSAEDVYGLVSDSLSEFDDLNIFPSSRLRLNLVNDGMLKKPNHLPKNFKYRYETFVALRRHFNANRVKPWSEMIVDVLGVKIFGNRIGLVLGSRHKISDERKAVYEVAGFENRDFKFKLSQFIPHVNVGILEPDAPNSSHLTYAEDTLREVIEQIPTVKLGALCLNIDNQKLWSFEGFDQA